MKQPKNTIDFRGGGCWVVIGDELDIVDIAIGATKREAIKLAIKRLQRLTKDAKKMLEKL